MTERYREYTLTTRTGEKLFMFEDEETRFSYAYDDTTDTLHFYERIKDESSCNFTFFRPVSIKIEWASPSEEELE